MHIHSDCSIIHNNQDVESAYKSINTQMGKGIEEHIHNGVLFSHKENEIVLCGGKWIELEIIMLSEIRQTQKIIGYFLLCIPLKLKKKKAENGVFDKEAEKRHERESRRW